MEKYLIGIDVGTTGTKTMLFTQQGDLLARAYRGYPLSNPQVGWCEQNPEDWWQAVVETVKEVCSTREICNNVAAISLSTQGGTIVPTDAQGQPLRSAIVWNDIRFQEQMDAFVREVGASDIMYRLTGWKLSPGLPALAIRWLKDNEPDVFAKTALFLSVPDYIAMKMTGIPAVDISNAGINQLCDIRAGEYSPQLMDFAGIKKEQLPKLVRSGTPIGQLTAKAAQSLGLSTDTLLVAGAHDQYAVALGAGAVHDGDILIGSGTCWVVTAITDQPGFDTGLSQSVSAVPGKWGSMQSLSSGGVCLDWLRKQVAEESDMSYETINAILDNRKAAEDKLFFFPFSGKADSNRRFQKASFTGLDLSHDRYHMAKAVMEGVVFQILWMMEDFSAKPSKDGIILSGGASKSPVWSQLLADISGMPVRIPVVADLACVGAAIMAGVGCGVFENEMIGYQKLAVEERYLQPDLNKTKMYTAAFALYKQQATALRN